MMRIALYGPALAVALAACARLAETEGHEVVRREDLPTPQDAEPADAVVCQLGPAAGVVAAAYAGTEIPIYAVRLDDDPGLLAYDGGYRAFAAFLAPPAPAAPDPAAAPLPTS